MKEFQPYFYRREDVHLPSATTIFIALLIFLYGIWSWFSGNIPVAVMCFILGFLILLIKPLKNVLKK